MIASSAFKGVALVAIHSSFSHSSPALYSLAANYPNTNGFPKLGLYEFLTTTKQEQVLEPLLLAKPLLVGFSTYLWNIKFALHCARLLKTLLPGTKVVFGGPEAGPQGQDLLNTYSYVDFVIEGEGEESFPALVQAIDQSEGYGSVSGLYYRAQDGALVHNSIVPADLQRLHSPFEFAGTQCDKRLVYLETTRGCPFRCRFCTSGTEPLRHFPLSRLQQDLERLKSSKAQVIKVLDRSFHAGKGRTLKILQLFLQTRSSLRFHLELNPDHLSPEVLQLFADAEPGKFQFEIGLQTLNETTLDRIDRKMEIAKSLENIHHLIGIKKHPVHLDLIAGLPGETPETFIDALDRVFLFFPNHLQLGTLKLLPGTGLREDAFKLGYKWDPEPPYEILASDTFSYTQFLRIKRYAALLEIFWNSHLFPNTLRWLVEVCFEEKVSLLFETLLVQHGNEVADQRSKPEVLFGLVGNLVDSYRGLEPNCVARELLLWDYLTQFELSGNTPKVVSRLCSSERVKIPKLSQKKLPVIHLSESGCNYMNKLLLNPLKPGNYALYLERASSGRPYQLIPMDLHS